MPARILVIEDDPNTLELMIYLLDAFGHSPLTAGNGVAGMTLASAERPDLIVCDIQLPELDGYGVARALAEDPRLSTIPLIAITALAMVGDRERILAAGFDGYMSKPIVPETFVGQLDHYLPPALHSHRPETRK
jgi:two-component system cell cycle response regulator DivK